jgi:hypothetical protein
MPVISEHFVLRIAQPGPEFCNILKIAAMVRSMRLLPFDKLRAGAETATNDTISHSVTEWRPWFRYGQRRALLNSTSGRRGVTRGDSWE